MKLNELFDIELPILLEMPEEDLIDAERNLKGKFMEFMGMNFTFRNHIFDHTGRTGREQHVTKEEVMNTLYKLITNKKHRGKMLGARQDREEYNAVVTDNDSNLNMAFAIDYGNRGDRNLFKVTTIMKKAGFKHKPHKDRHRFYV